MAATSIVRDRGRAFGLVIALAMSAALVSAPTAFGAVDGDTIATSTFNVKLSKGFKKQLRRNGVKMKPKRLQISTRGNSDVDPTTGQGDLLFKTIRFKLNRKGKRICKSNTTKNKQCRRKVAYKKLRGSMPGVVRGSSGKLFRLTAPTVARNGFGADVSGVKVKFLRAAAKQLNRRFHLNSLKPRNVGRLALSYQPEEVKILSGTAQTTGATSPGSVGIKFLSHCVIGIIPNGIGPIAPATQPGGPATTFFFPVTGGEIAPDGTSGLVEQAGGVRINKNSVAGPCNNGFLGELHQVGLQVNVTDRTVSSEVTIVSAPPTVFTGPRGRAVGQTLDPTNTVVTSDPVNRTISLSGTRVLLAPVSAQVLNGVFPNTSGNPANDFAGGDLFGTSQLTVQTR